MDFELLVLKVLVVVVKALGLNEDGPLMMDLRKAIEERERSRGLGH